MRPDVEKALRDHLPANVDLGFGTTLVGVAPNSERWVTGRLLLERQCRAEQTQGRGAMSKQNSPAVRFSAEPGDAQAFTSRFDRMYTRLARPYDLAVKVLPVWRHWLSAALPHIRGPRVLEISFGTGWLLTRYAGNFETHGIDLNERMVAIAQRNLQRAGVTAQLRQANVEALPYPDGHFNTVINTMAFSGYPNGQRAMSELHRVLRPQGRLVLIDMGYPHDGNPLGSALVGMWKRAGDVIRDMPPLFASFGFDVYHEQIGGFGSVHLYVATKQ